ncbi:hypothetical protein, partial [Streptomyces europaeiscabiei]|uniref:hypothetical protein n=1 Tax=Streptomyces europaeiscabiei TaxID=146819 RepID=UPI0029AA80B0
AIIAAGIDFRRRMSEQAEGQDPPDDATDDPFHGSPEPPDNAPGHTPAPTAGTDRRADDTTGRTTGRTTDKKVL